MKESKNYNIGLRLVASNGKRIDANCEDEGKDCNYTKTLQMHIPGAMWEEIVKRVAREKGLNELDALKKVVECGVLFIDLLLDEGVCVKVEEGKVVRTILL